MNPADSDYGQAPCQHEPCRDAARYCMSCDNPVFGGLCSAFLAFPDGAAEEEIRAKYDQNKAALDADYARWKAKREAERACSEPSSTTPRWPVEDPPRPPERWFTRLLRRLR